MERGLAGERSLGTRTGTEALPAQGTAPPGVPRRCKFFQVILTRAKGSRGNVLMSFSFFLSVFFFFIEFIVDFVFEKVTCVSDYKVIQTVKVRHR